MKAASAAIWSAVRLALKAGMAVPVRPLVIVSIIWASVMPDKVVALRAGANPGVPWRLTP